MSFLNHFAIFSFAGGFGLDSTAAWQIFTQLRSLSSNVTSSVKSPSLLLPLSAFCIYS